MMPADSPRRDTVPLDRAAGTVPIQQKSNWTDTFVAHSRNRLIHHVRYHFYERAFFRHLANTDAAILDVGCGAGEFIHLLQQRGYKNLYGVEIDDTLLDMAAGTISDVRKASATALPYEDGSFDCVYMFNVMHHLQDVAEYEQALAEMTRCVRDGGRIILVEPCHLFLYWLLKTACFLGRPFGAFFRNFYLILAEEWPKLSLFLRQVDTLRQKIAADRRYLVVEDTKLLHQWTTVVEVRK